MDEVKKSIVANLENGLYFVDAKNWYARVYMFPVVERSIFAVFALFLLLCFSIIALKIDSLLPLQVEVPLLLHLPDTLDEVPFIKPIDYEDVNSNIPVATYMASKYVMRRESYDYSALAEQVTYMKNNSSQAIFKEFYNNLSLSNPNSPLVLYQRKKVKDVEIVKVDHDKIAQKIEVRYKSYIKELGQDTIITENIATIEYEMSDVLSVIKDQTEMYFIVINYKTEELKS